MALSSIETLFEHELKDLYDAEKRLTKALPKMAGRAVSDELRDALENHTEVTNKQVERLEQIFSALDMKPAAKTCLGMKGLIEEGEEVLEAEGEDPFTDLAIIGVARRVEHYETAAYLALQSLATEIGDSTIQDLIRQNLEEEQAADTELADIAEQLLEIGDEEAEDDEGDEDANLSDELKTVNKEDEVVKKEPQPARKQPTARRTKTGR